MNILDYIDDPAMREALEALPTPILAAINCAADAIYNEAFSSGYEDGFAENDE